jgi:hypothetical protein
MSDVGDGFAPARPNDSSARTKATLRSPRRREAAAYRATEIRSIMPSSEDQETADKTNDQHEDMVVKILTDDPNVVIYWLVDQKSGGF